MLETLHNIVQAVNTAPDLQQALHLIVTRVKQAIQCNVCSIYLTDDDNRANVLMASDGLRAESIGKVRLPIGRGLVGLVTERAESVNLADASLHPRYVRISDTGETHYRGFLGAPIIQNRRVLGVIVVRQQETREFNETEVTFIFTLAAQLAGAITYARASGELEKLIQGNHSINHFLNGRSGNTGVAIGQGVVTYRSSNLDAVPDHQTSDIDAECDRFRLAVEQVSIELRHLQENLDPRLPVEDRALFDALILMLNSDTLLNHTLERIQQGQWAPAALRQTIQTHARIFEDMEDAYLRERATDIRDLGRRILTQLQNEPSIRMDYPEHTILVGDEISAIQLAEVPQEKLVGVVSAQGSSSSHAAILARAIGVPAIMGVTNMPVGRMQNRALIIDGYRGRLYVEPLPSVREEYARLLNQERALSAEVEAMRGLSAETADGVHIPLYLNTGLINETGGPNQAEAEGIGLYRTELPFMIRDRFPSETEQMMNYKRVLEAFEPRPVVLRTLDIGGDKSLSYFPVNEQNPFLGWRGIRISLQHPEIFLTQIRAMLQADLGHGNLQIMLPMITQVNEVDELLELIQRAHDELLEEKLPVTMPPIGVMIEVPSAVYQMTALARRVDFISIGTNDLTQYLLAVDRNNPRVADLYDDLHPAVLHALKQIVDRAKAMNKPVSVCGELAGNPLATVLMLGLGVDSLSMSAGSLLRVKWVLRSFSQVRARQLLAIALQKENAEQVRQFLERVLDNMGLGGLLRPGK
jgi:phosphotransferase system enzyme I (PtsP)